MKKTILFFTSVFALSQNCALSQNEYFANNPKWGISEPCQFAPLQPEWGKKTTYHIDGDTLLNAEVFMKVFQVGFEYYGLETADYTETAYSNPLPLAYLRSESMKMFKWNEELQVKELLYDFEVEVGEPFNSILFTNPPTVVSISTITLGGFERKVITVSEGSSETCSFDYIEGVGHWRGIWHPNDQQLDCQSYLTCFSLNGESYFVNTEETPWLEPSTEDCEFVVGIGEMDSPEISIYPNPTKSALNIRSATIISSIEISDPTGRVVFTSKPNDKFCDINSESFAKGCYFMVLTSDNGNVQILKFLKD